MFFEQVKCRGDNFSYVIADETTKEAVIVDPSFNSDMLIKIAREHSLNVEYIINTHQHHDHIAGNDNIRSTLKAKIIAHELSRIRKDISVIDGENLKVGRLTVNVIHTPGHSPDSICLLIENKLLSGDTLFVGECGRTDLPGGSTADLYHSLFGKLVRLDENVEVYPGHDYGSRPHSTIGIEKKTNYTLEKRSLQEFVEFMAEP